MGLLSWLLGPPRAPATPPTKPPRDVRLTAEYGGAGCWWGHPEVLALAPGRGFTVEVVGESKWQDNLSRICGGKCEDGYNVEVPAQLVFEDNPVDPNAVGVMIDSQRVGWIPAERAPEFRAAMSAINPHRRAMTCKAKIVGGWDRGRHDKGSFGVKLSLSWPLKPYSPPKT